MIDEMKAAGWSFSRDELSARRGSGRIAVHLMRAPAGLVEVAAVYAPGVCYIAGDSAPMTLPNHEGVRAALVSLGAKMMPNGGTVAEWVLGPVAAVEVREHCARRKKK